MGIADDAVEIRAQGWRALAAVHGIIESSLEKALQSEHDLSVVEYTVLDALSRQHGWHMRMQQLARATALSSSATTRLVTRLEDRGLLTRILCVDDRRGIYTSSPQQATNCSSGRAPRTMPPCTPPSKRPSRCLSSRLSSMHSTRYTPPPQSELPKPSRCDLRARTSAVTPPKRRCVELKQ